MRWTQELAKVMALLMGKDTKEALDLIDSAMRDQIGLDPDQLERMNHKELLDYLQQKDNLNLGQIEFIAGLFYEKYKRSGASDKVWSPHLAKAYTLLKHVHEHADTYSLDRKQKLDSMARELPD